jgi:hypothetical protein
MTMQNRVGQVWEMNQIGKNIFLIIDNPIKHHTADSCWFYPVKWILNANSQDVVFLPCEISEVSLECSSWMRRIV